MRKVSIPEDNSRKIASRSHNSYVQEGIDSHQSTQVAPSALLQPFHESLKGRLVSQFKLVKEQLRSCLGEPFYADAGFILYEGDLTQLLSNLSKSTLKIDLTITSPPYNIGKEYEKLMSINEYIDWCSSWMNQIYEVTKPS